MAGSDQLRFDRLRGYQAHTDVRLACSYMYMVNSGIVRCRCFVDFTYFIWDFEKLPHSLHLGNLTKNGKHRENTHNLENKNSFGLETTLRW